MNLSNKGQLIPTIKRSIIYFAGVAIYAYSVCLMTKADIGMPPITSIGHVLTFITPYSLGVTQFFVNIFFIVLQIILLRSNFKGYQYLQIIVSFAFSFFIEAFMPMVSMFNPEIMSLSARVILLLSGIVVGGFGLTFITISNFIMLPGDGLARAIAYKLKWEFGKGKVLIDVLCVLTTLVISFAVLRRLESIQVGTVIVALFLGNVVRIIMRSIKEPLDSFMDKVSH